MRYQTFVEHLPQQFPVALLAPKLEVDGITREYLDPHTLDPNDLIAYQLHITGKTTPAVEQKGFLDDLLPVLQDMGSEYILVTDSAYFKTLTGVNKAEPYLGYVLPNTYPVSMANQFNVIFVPNYRQVFYDPQRTKDKITQALDALFSHRNDHYQEPGNSIIHFEAYPDTLTEIAAWLQKLMAYPALTADIEAFSLRHYDAGIGSISFAWNQHEGIAFAVDLGTDPVAIRRMLLKFFKEYKGNIKWHNGSYDLTVLVYQLFMNHLLDYEGLLEGLSIMLDRDWDDTKLVAYFATNSCAGNKLSLKDLAQEYAGNYAQSDIDDITKIPLPELLGTTSWTPFPLGTSGTSTGTRSSLTISLIHTEGCSCLLSLTSFRCSLLACLSIEPRLLWPGRHSKKLWLMRFAVFRTSPSSKLSPTRWTWSTLLHATPHSKQSRSRWATSPRSSIQTLGRNSSGCFTKRSGSLS